MKVLEKLPLYEKNPPEKSYLNIIKSNQDIDDFLRYLIFLTVHGYLTSFSNVNLTVNSHKRESKCVGNSRLSLIAFYLKLWIVFIFKSAQQQCNDLTWAIHVFWLLAALKSVVLYMWSRCALFYFMRANGMSHMLLSPKVGGRGRVGGVSISLAFLGILHYCHGEGYMLWII